MNTLFLNHIKQDYGEAAAAHVQTEINNGLEGRSVVGALARALTKNTASHIGQSRPFDSEPLPMTFDFRKMQKI